MAWPQWIVLGLSVFGITLYAVKEGESRGSYHVGEFIIHVSLTAWLLWMGSFFVEIRWPQIVWFSLVTMSFAFYVAKHGQSKEPYRVLAILIDTCITLWLFWVGGFFS